MVSSGIVTEEAISRPISAAVLKVTNECEKWPRSLFFGFVSQKLHPFLLVHLKDIESESIKHCLGSGMNCKCVEILFWVL